MDSNLRNTKLLELEEKFKIKFPSFELIGQALTHSSYVNEQKQDGLNDNERMEFMGDAVLKLVVSEYLYKRFPGYSEGDLTKIRAAVVSDLSLSEISVQLDLGSYLLLGNNEKRSGGSKKRSNTANALEAIIAAIYLENGIEKTSQVVIDLLKDQIDKASADDFMIDYKSALQELSQKNKWGLPNYQVIKELGPKHKRVFLIEVKVNGTKCGTGKGLSKKEAEQDAAMSALNKVKSGGVKKWKP